MYMGLSKGSYKRTEKWARSQTRTWALPGFPFRKARRESWQRWPQKQTLATRHQGESGALGGACAMRPSYFLFCSSLRERCVYSAGTLFCALCCLISVSLCRTPVLWSCWTWSLPLKVLKFHRFSDSLNHFNALAIFVKEILLSFHWKLYFFFFFLNSALKTWEHFKHECGFANKRCCAAPSLAGVP